MPRRRGEYTLTKSTSFTVFPTSYFTDKAFYSAKNADQGTYKAKICLGTTSAPANCATLTSDTHEVEQQSSLSSAKESYQQESSLSSVDESYQQESSLSFISEQSQQETMQKKKKIKNSYRQKLLQLSPPDFSIYHTAPREYTYANRSKRQYRTTSHDSSFRNSLKYSLEKIKLRVSSQKYAKRESKLTGGIISVIHLIPDMSIAVERNGLSGKDSWKRPSKVHRSKSGAPKILSVKLILFKLKLFFFWKTLLILLIVLFDCASLYYLNHILINYIRKKVND